MAFFFILALGVVGMLLPTGSSGDADAAKAEQVEQTISASGDTEILRDESGSFHVKGQANGEDLSFLIDTGADLVALTIEDAERLGITVDRDSFTPVAQTASGVGYGTQVQIERLTIADQELRDVEALVMDGLKTNLLGQSVLRKLGNLEIQPDKLVIRRS